MKAFRAEIISGAVTGSRATLHLRSLNGGHAVASFSNVKNVLPYLRRGATLFCQYKDDGEYSVLIVSSVRFEVCGKIEGADEISVPVGADGKTSVSLFLPQAA